MSIDFDAMTLTDFIQLEAELQRQLKRRFERNLALVFTDVVGSTAYFARYGDVAGRGLQQLHFDLLSAAMAEFEGRIVDTAGDGAFSVFATAEKASDAMTRMQHLLVEANQHRATEHQLQVRVGLHWGPVLTDDKVVSGDAVNLCARVAGTGQPSELRLTRAAFLELPTRLRIRCRPTPAVPLKGISQPVELMILEWREKVSLPTRVAIQETGEELKLPTNKDTVSFGRLREVNGQPANDVVLVHPEPQNALMISRWHFELRRQSDGFRLRQLSEQLTEVDGVEVTKGNEVPLRPGSVVRLSGVLTLRFLADSEGPISGPVDPLMAHTLAVVR